MIVIILILIALCPLESFSQQVNIEKVSYDLFKNKGITKSFHTDTIIPAGKVEMYFIENKSDEDQILFIARKSEVKRTLDNDITYFLFGTAQPDCEVSFFDSVVETMGQRNISYWSIPEVYESAFLKLLEPGEKFRLVCTYSDINSNENFESRIITCPATLFFKNFSKDEVRHIKRNKYLYPYDTFTVIL